MVRGAGRVPPAYSKIGDDVATVPLGKGKLVVKVDMLVERTDMPRGMTYRQAARKAVAMCVSDFAAKGVSPDSFLISLGLRRGITDAQVEELARGFRDAEKEWNVSMVGGDTNEAGELIIDCAMVGFGSRVVSRRGCRPGDLLVVTGPFGYPPSGLKILGENARASEAFRRKAIDSVLFPRPSLEAGLALAPYLTSGMDSSDGLGRSLHTLAAMSGVGFEVDSLPMGEGVGSFARLNRLDPERLVLAGGEEYVVVATLQPGRVEGAKEALRRVGGKLLKIGWATKESGSVVSVIKGSPEPIPDEGWTHLR
jgi:thiamine-monophosphate kinase